MSDGSGAGRYPEQDDYEAERRLPRSVRTAREALRLFKRGELESALVRLEDLATWTIEADIAKAATGVVVPEPEPRGGQMRRATEVVAEAIRQGDRL